MISKRTKRIQGAGYRSDRRIGCFVAGIVALSVLGAGTARGATATWDGSIDADWNSTSGGDSNWTGGAGTNGRLLTNDSAVLTSATGLGGLNLNNNLTSGSFNIAGITFNAGAAAFIIGNGTATPNVGNTFVLTGNVTNNSTNLQTIHNPFSMTASRNFTTSAGGGDITLGGNISGTGGWVYMQGAGTLTLRGTNTYTGPTTTEDGVLLLASAGALPSNSRTRLLGGIIGLGAGNFTRSLGTGATQVDWASTLGGGFAAYGADRIVNIGGSGGTVTWNTSGMSGNFVATGQPFLLGHATADATLNFQNNINFNGAVREVRVGNGSAAVDAMLSGILSNGGLNKTGFGTLNLTANNSYTGATNVNAGTLLVNGSTHASSTVTVASGATLGGTGIIGGNTVIKGTHSPGNSPGIQTFAGNLTYDADPDAPIVDWELIDNTVTNLPNPNALFDTIVVGGTLDFADPTALDLIFDAAGSVVDWTDSFWATSHLGTSGWLLYDVAGTTTNFGNLSITPENWLDGNTLAFNSVRAGSSFSLVQDGNDIYLNYTFNEVSTIPEPSSYALALLGLAGLGFAAWQRRSLDANC